MLTETMIVKMIAVRIKEKTSKRRSARSANEGIRCSQGPLQPASYRLLVQSIAAASPGRPELGATPPAQLQTSEESETAHLMSNEAGQHLHSQPESACTAIVGSRCREAPSSDDGSSKHGGVEAKAGCRLPVQSSEQQGGDESSLPQPGELVWAMADGWGWLPAKVCSPDEFAPNKATAATMAAAREKRISALRKKAARGGAAGGPLPPLLLVLFVGDRQWAWLDGRRQVQRMSTVPHFDAAYKEGLAMARRKHYVARFKRSLERTAAVIAAAREDALKAPAASVSISPANATKGGKPANRDSAMMDASGVSPPSPEAGGGPSAAEAHHGDPLRADAHTDAAPLCRDDSLDKDPLTLAQARRQRALQLVRCEEKHGLTPAWVLTAVVRIFQLEVTGASSYAEVPAASPSPLKTAEPVPDAAECFPPGKKHSMSCRDHPLIPGAKIWTEFDPATKAPSGTARDGDGGLPPKASIVDIHRSASTLKDISAAGAPEERLQIGGTNNVANPLSSSALHCLALGSEVKAPASAGGVCLMRRDTGSSGTGSFFRSCSGSGGDHSDHGDNGSGNGGDTARASVLSGSIDLALLVAPNGSVTVDLRYPAAQGAAGSHDTLLPGQAAASLPQGSSAPGESKHAWAPPSGGTGTPGEGEPAAYSRKRCGQCARCQRPACKKACLHPILRPILGKRRQSSASAGEKKQSGSRRGKQARSAGIPGGASRGTVPRCGQCRPCRVPTLRQPCVLRAQSKGVLPVGDDTGAPAFHLTERPKDDLMVHGLLDPSSNSLVRPNIPAQRLYTAAEDGLEMENSWSELFVYLNPPYDSALQWRFINRAIDEVESGRCEGAIILCRGSPDTNWWPRLRPYPRVLCRRRAVQFLDYYKTPIAFGVAIFCLVPQGPNQMNIYQRFYATLQHKGEVCIPIDASLMASHAFSSLLSRLHTQATANEREHWLRCDSCCRWRRVPFAMWRRWGGSRSSAGEWTCREVDPRGCNSADVKADSRWQYGRLEGGPVDNSAVHEEQMKKTPKRKAVVAAKRPRSRAAEQRAAEEAQRKARRRQARNEADLANLLDQVRRLEGWRLREEASRQGVVDVAQFDSDAALRAAVTEAAVRRVMGEGSGGRAPTEGDAATGTADGNGMKDEEVEVDETGQPGGEA
eukprot:jgi/Tetstr1/461094/TSEL_006237.t1